MERTFDPHSPDAGVAFNAARPKSAASWGAILAGALVAISVSLVMVALGTGLGFAAMSPWSNQGVEASTFSIAAVIWLIAMQWVSSLLGGYIAGRLRTRWIGTHAHEVFFRDTANGLVTWALATVVVSALVASSLASGIGGGVKAASSVASAGAEGAAHAAMAGGSSSDFGYGVDKLFRAAGPSASSAGAAGAAPAMGPGPGMGPGSGGPGSGHEERAEATRILVNAMANGGLPDADRAYLVSLVAARTGMSDTEAQRRVDDLVASANEAQTKVKAAADMARKDAAQVAIYTALAMLIGAFIASVSAALGGRLRDEHI